MRVKTYQRHGIQSKAANFTDNAIIQIVSKCALQIIYIPNNSSCDAIGLCSVHDIYQYALLMMTPLFNSTLNKYSNTHSH